VSRTNTTDEFFIDAAPQRVYEALVGTSTIEEWWPGARVSAPPGRIALRIPVPRRAARPVAFEARVDGLRPGEGLTWWIEEGELHGRGEWWLEAFKSGTIVHYYLDVDRGDGSRRVPSAVRRHRWAVRRGINALKDRLEGRA
jgi:uncharacterized protein YndB with AHSA1/START domain